MNLETFEDIKKKLKEIKKMGFIKTHRSGQTGIGKTIEDLLGIEENNIPWPNALGWIELKAIRKRSKSLVTLFTLAPSPPKINSVLLEKYGYFSSKGERKILHTTVNGVDFNLIKNEKGFKIDVTSDKVNLIHYKDGVVAYWEEKKLRERIERKMRNLLLIKAETQGKGENEKFWFDEGYLLNEFNFEKFKILIRKGVILVDIRIGQYPNGRTHDHGTGFRIFSDNLDLCYIRKVKIL
ncbi:MAG: MvaI/BcnI family restriction endonuclease [Candidatus Omnitrophica bacterium]|nr:MvaI/BcnI family restriction endonuclease [Candidatus Omnitrophota bacterium]MCM8802326.1 MvaI/BcnI family restriction endonuclease [Candidatus Omnitrophota bacterium]